MEMWTRRKTSRAEVEVLAEVGSGMERWFLMGQDRNRHPQRQSEPTKQTVEQAWASGLQRPPLPSPSLSSSSFSLMSNLIVNWIGSGIN